MKKLCRQWTLPAGLILFCAVLVAGKTVGNILTKGVDFEYMTIGVVAPEGDDTPALIEKYAGKLRDVREYCTFLALSPEETDSALVSGTVSAVLSLPAGFLSGVMDSTNPDVVLILPSDAPLKALLACSAGSAAADMLSAFQLCIYSVLDSYDQSTVTTLSREDVIFDINLKCISWTLGRENCFTYRTVNSTGSLSPVLHYTLSLLAYLSIACAPLVSVLYDKSNLNAQRRLRAVGHGTFACWLSAIIAVMMLLFPVLFAIMCLCGVNIVTALYSAAVWSLFSVCEYALFSLLFTSVSGCGTAAFLFSFVSLFIAGGILPPILLPNALQRIMWLSPITGMRQLASGTYELLPMLSLMSEWIIASIAGILLYRRRMERGQA